jgi:hypothetical protein
MSKSDLWTTGCSPVVEPAFGRAGLFLEQYDPRKKKFRPLCTCVQANAIVIEEKASGTRLIQELAPSGT